MKKYFLIILLILGTYLSSQELTFRGFKFGTDINKIIEKEGEPDKKYTSDEMIQFGDLTITYNKKEVANYSAGMQIEFRENKMILGCYLLELEQKDLLFEIYDPKNFVNAYNDLIKKLTKLYKSPKKTNEIDNIDVGVSALFAKSIADLTPYDTLWEIDNGAIFLRLDYKEKWSLGLFYCSPEIYKEIQKRQNSTEGL